MVDRKQIIVIGAGIAGLTAAQELAHRGQNVLVVDKAPFFGGYAANLACKASDKCLKCNNCIVEDKLKEISEHRKIDIRLSTRVENIEKNSGKLNVALSSGPKFIDPEKCNNCGLCKEKCPTQGAIIESITRHNNPAYAIDPLKCEYILGNEKEAHCVAVCPEGAINIDEQKDTWVFEADGLVVATGYEPFDPAQNKRFSFHRYKNMVTAMDLEKILRNEGKIMRPSDNTSPKNIAFIQCVGSRDSHINRDYCSRICCGFALRMALRIIHDDPDVKISFFYMDIQNFGKDFDNYYSRIKDKINLIRGLPGDFYSSDNDGLSINYYDEEEQKPKSKDFDMVVLSVGLSPAQSNISMGTMLGLEIDEDGFLRNDSSIDGVVVAGSAEGPMDASESINHAKRAAYEMARYLKII